MAVAGPRTVQIPAWTQLATVTDTEPTQIHLTRRNAAHPARMSARRFADAARGDGASGPDRCAQMAATRKLTASRAIAQPPPAAATTIPASGRPTMLVSALAALSME